MDLLDQVLVPGQDLLTRVDSTITSFGAPQDDEIWRLVRAVGALPSDVLASVAALRVDAFVDLGVELRGRADRYAGRRAVLAAAVAANRWEGSAGAAFAARWRAISDYFGDGESPDEASMAGRLVALREYADVLQDWITDTRRSLAMTVADVLGSAEAVQVRSAGLTEPVGGAAQAAVTIAVRVLRTADEVLRQGFDTAIQWRCRLGELPFQLPTVEPVTGQVTQVDL